MPTFSQDMLNVTYTPSISCSIEWTTSDPYIVLLSPSGSKVKLETNCNSGTALVTAILTDTTGKQTSCSCQVTVYSTSTTLHSQTQSYDAYLTVSVGSDDAGTQLAETLVNRFRSAFGAYPSSSDTLRFTSLGNSRYGAILTRNGSPVTANYTYSYYDWADLYFSPSAAGTYVADYRFGYGSRTAEGSIRITVQSSNLTVVMSQASLRMASTGAS